MSNSEILVRDGWGVVAPSSDVTFEWTREPLMLAQASTTSTLRFDGDDGLILSIDLGTGRVTIGEGVTLDAASAAFWEHVQAAFPGRAG